MCRLAGIMTTKYEYKNFTVRIRRDVPGKLVRPECEQIDGKTYRFLYAWEMDEGDRYPGEIAWEARDDAYPRDCPVWIASGDLVPA